MRFPELYHKIGVNPPKGVLIYGPSGSGKTLLAKTLAAETGAHVVLVHGSEILSKLSGESEAFLRKAFEDAEKHAPAIIILDELETICPRRDKNNPVGDVERRLISSLGSLMDKLNQYNSSSTKKHHVVVVGTTAKPNMIDGSLRRYGRFDKEINLNVPDAQGRAEILRIKTKDMALDEESVDLGSISKQTHGYVGADISQLVNEAGYNAVHEQSTQIQKLLQDPTANSDAEHWVTTDNDGNEILSDEYLSNLSVKNSDFEHALKTTNPSSLRENVVEIPNVSWEDVGGLEDVKQELFETIQYPIMYSKLFEKFGMSPSRGVLFYGPPGCGKTMLAKAVANECQANFISIKGPELLTMWFGESEANVRDIFDKARAAAPCILFFDELDSIAKTRSSNTQGGSEAADRVINQILTEIDGLGSNNKDIFIIGATNRPDVLDPAMTRPGRLDQLIYIPLPDTASRRNIFLTALKKTPLSEDVNIEILVNRTEGYSGADITEICQRAVKLAIREIVSANTTNSVDLRALLRQDHLLESLSSARKSVNEMDIMKYAEFANNMKFNFGNRNNGNVNPFEGIAGNRDAINGGSNSDGSFPSMPVIGSVPPSPPRTSTENPLDDTGVPLIEDEKL